MDKQKVARELVRLARELTAADVFTDWDEVDDEMSRSGWELTTTGSPASLNATWAKPIATGFGKIPYLAVVDRDGTAELRLSAANNKSWRELYKQVGGSMAAEIEDDLRVVIRAKDARELVKKAAREFITARRYMAEVFEQLD